MASSLVLMAACPDCGSEEFRHLDDDACYERYLESGKPEQDYNAVRECSHYACVRCGYQP